MCSDKVTSQESFRAVVAVAAVAVFRLRASCLPLVASIHRIRRSRRTRVETSREAGVAYRKPDASRKAGTPKRVKWPSHVSSSEEVASQALRMQCTKTMVTAPIAFNASISA